MRRFEFRERGSSKFWQIAQAARGLTIRHGRIGTEGQTREKTFATAEAARAEHDRLVREKLGKGYVERSAGQHDAAAARKSTPATTTIRAKVFADYSQFHLADEASDGDLEAAWTVQASEDRLAVGRGVMGVGTARNMDVPVEIELLSAAPADDTGSFQHVTECSLELPTARMFLRGPTDVRAVRRFAVPKGTVRISVSHAGLDTLSDNGSSGKDHYRVQIWAGRAIAARVAKRWTEPERIPVDPKTVPPPKTCKQAVAAALAGRSDLALQKLAHLSRRRADALAAVSAAEICAFQGDWRGVIEHAGVFIAEPTPVGTDVLETTLALLARAARETRDRAAVETAAKRLPKTAGADLHEILRAFLGNLRASRTSSKEERPRPTAASREEYAKLLRETPHWKGFEGDEPKRQRYLFEAAEERALDDEALAVFTSHTAAMEFPHAVCAARILAGRGRADAAWATLEDRLGRWHAEWICSVAPVELLVDAVLSPLMTEARCARVLATPRGQG